MAILAAVFFVRTKTVDSFIFQPFQISVIRVHQWSFLAKQKKPGSNSSRQKKQQERFKLHELRVEVEFNDHAGFFRGGFVFPLDHGSGYSMYQHGIST